MKLIIRDQNKGMFLRMMSFNIFETLRVMGVHPGPMQHKMLKFAYRTDLRDLMTVKFYMNDGVYNEFPVPT